MCRFFNDALCVKEAPTSDSCVLDDVLSGDVVLSQGKYYCERAAVVVGGLGLRFGGEFDATAVKFDEFLTCTQLAHLRHLHFCGLYLCQG